MIEDDLVEFENDDKVLEYRYLYKDIPIWPYVRDLLVRRAWLDKQGTMLVNLQHTKKNIYNHYITYNSFNLPKKDLLFIVQSGDLIEEKGHIFDRLMDGFVKLDKDNSAKMIECYSEFNFKKLCNEGIPFSTDIFIRKIIEYKGERQVISKKEVKVIDDFISYLKKNIPFYVEEGIYGAVREKAVKTVTDFPAYYIYYNKLLDIVQPKIVFCNCGIYGLPQIKVINDYGILTAEYQHGTIEKHFDYMYGQAVSESVAYKECMPKYLLTWGDYWTIGKNIPVNIYKIGNSIVQENIEKFKEMQGSTGEQANILIITSAMHKWCVEFIYYILDNVLLNDYKIIVKLHPTQPEMRKYYEQFMYNKRVNIVSDGLIYDYFAVSKYVVGDLSTAMYEAAAVGKKVFVIDNEVTRNYLNHNFGIWIKNAEQFIEKMDTDENTVFCKEDFFESNWEQNYLRFLREVVYNI